MKIEHLAIRANDIERMKDFYTQYFDAIPGEKYFNPSKDFTSYFLSFEAGCRLELMHKPSILNGQNNDREEYMGIVHFAISVGSKKAVDQLTERLRSDGFKIIGEPRTTGDGYYESVILDPENNRIEITI